AIALVTTEHLAHVRRELAALGVDVDARITEGQLALVDADAVYAEACTNPGVDLAIVEQRVLQPIRDLGSLFGHVVGFGELVDIFARAGDRDAAIVLERWWNLQLAGHSLELACGYTLDAFDSGDNVDAFKHVCDAHTAVGVDRTPGDSEADRLRVELAQVTTALASEMARRQAVEAAYEATRAGRGQLVRLDRLAAALGE